MLTPQFLLPVHDEITVDLFAGGGGASTGIEQAIGRSVDIAINHDPEAVSLHQVNHPQTQHHVSDVFEVDPIAVAAGRRVGLLWASPDCTFHSKARGGKPHRDRNKARRQPALAGWCDAGAAGVLPLAGVEGRGAVRLGAGQCLLPQLREGLADAGRAGAVVPRAPRLDLPDRGAARESSHPGAALSAVPPVGPQQRQHHPGVAAARAGKHALPRPVRTVGCVLPGPGALPARGGARVHDADPVRPGCDRGLILLSLTIAAPIEGGERVMQSDSVYTALSTSSVPTAAPRLSRLDLDRSELPRGLLE